MEQRRQSQVYLGSAEPTLEVRAEMNLFKLCLTRRRKTEGQSRKRKSVELCSREKFLFVLEKNFSSKQNSLWSFQRKSGKCQLNGHRHYLFRKVSTEPGKQVSTKSGKLNQNQEKLNLFRKNGSKR